MGELGRRFQRHRVLRGFAEATKESYTGAMLGLFRAYGGTPPDRMMDRLPQGHRGQPGAGARLPRALHPPRRHLRPPHPRHRRRRRHLLLARPRRRQRREGDDPSARRLHRPLPAACPAQGLPESPRLRLARAAPQARRACGDPGGAWHTAAPAAGRRDRARTHPAAHPRGCHPLPGLRQGVPGLHPRTSPRPRRPRMNMPSPQKSTSRHDAHSGRCCGAMSASGGNASSGICALHPFMAKCLERAVFTHPLVVADGSGAAHAAKGNRRSAIQTP